MNEPIWKQVYECAQELTSQGTTPFTRQDLIQRLQKKEPDSNPDSINPIIQGMTDNLRGGAPGSVGKDLLHSVGRGLFIVKTKQQPTITSQVDTIEQATKSNPMEIKASIQRPTDLTLTLLNKSFSYICTLEPERSEAGLVLEDRPQDRYLSDRTEITSLNQGEGEWCNSSLGRRDVCQGVKF